MATTAYQEEEGRKTAISPPLSPHGADIATLPFHRTIFPWAMATLAGLMRLSRNSQTKSK